MTLAIDLSKISKSFPGVKANDDINLKIKEVQFTPLLEKMVLVNLH